MRRRQGALAPAHRLSPNSTWGVALLAVVVLTAVLLLAACGGSSDSASTTAVTGASSTSSTAAAALGADELGAQIGTIYVTALKDAALALKDKPDVAAVRTQIEQLKNDTIAKLVELGRAREAMGTSDRAKVDAKITAALGAVGSEDWYVTYNEVWKHYSGVDSDFANTVAAFNVIGQYANFDLLKQQLPAEATRLGIN